MKIIYIDSRPVLFADEGMYVTNGDVHGKQIYLGEGVDPESYTEITEKEYEVIMAQEVVEEYEQ